jgi:hypothetical protein
LSFNPQSAIRNPQLEGVTLSDNVFRWNAGGGEEEEKPRGKVRVREPVREVTLQDLGELSLRATVAFAARCARRVQPYFNPPEDFPHRAQAMQVVEEAILLAEQYAGATASSFANAAAAAKIAFNLGEATYPLRQLAPYAAYHAARAVVKAASAGERATQTVATEVLAAAYGSSRVVISGGSGTPPGAETVRFVHEALRADFEALRALNLGGFCDMGDPIDSSEAGPLGPLWRGGPPAW